MVFLTRVNSEIKWKRKGACPSLRTDQIFNTVYFFLSLVNWLNSQCWFPYTQGLTFKSAAFPELSEICTYNIVYTNKPKGQAALPLSPNLDKLFFLSFFIAFEIKRNYLCRICKNLISNYVVRWSPVTYLKYRKQTLDNHYPRAGLAQICLRCGKPTTH